MKDQVTSASDRNERINALATRVLQCVEAGATQQADDVYQMSSAVYSDPRRFELEIERIFKALPLVLGLTAEIPEIGDFKTIEIARTPILVTRAVDGRVRAFLNACRHRGVPLTDAPCGKASRFTCIYHGWTFRNDGRLLAIAEPEKFGAIDKATRNLIKLPCEERAGLVFGMLRPGAAMDLDGFYGDLLEDLAPFGFDQWTLLSKCELEGANWKIAFDGYLENYHFATAHRDTLARLVPGGSCAAYDSFGPHMRFVGADKSIRELRDVPVSERWARENQNFRVLRLIFPNISFSQGFGGVGQVAQILPGATVAENRTILYQICCRPALDEAEANARAEMRDFLVEVLRKEDYGLGLAVQKSMGAGIPFNVLFGRNEPANQHFHKWVEYYVSDRSGAPPPSL